MSLLSGVCGDRGSWLSSMPLVYPSYLRSVKPPFWHHGVHFPEANQWDTPMVEERPPQPVRLNRFYSYSLTPKNHVKYRTQGFQLTAQHCSNICTDSGSPSPQRGHLLSCWHCSFNVWFITWDDSWVQLLLESHLRKCKCCQAVTQYSHRAYCMEHWRNCFTLSPSYRRLTTCTVHNFGKKFGLKEFFDSFLQLYFHFVSFGFKDASRACNMSQCTNETFITFIVRLHCRHIFSDLLIWSRYPAPSVGYRLPTSCTNILYPNFNCSSGIISKKQ